jgi:hypothetical protein
MEMGEVNEYEIKGCYFQESKNQYEYKKNGIFLRMEIWRVI